MPSAPEAQTQGQPLPRLDEQENGDRSSRGSGGLRLESLSRAKARQRWGESRNKVPPWVIRSPGAPRLTPIRTIGLAAPPAPRSPLFERLRHTDQRGAGGQRVTASAALVEIRHVQNTVSRDDAIRATGAWAGNINGAAFNTFVVESRSRRTHRNQGGRSRHRRRNHSS